MTMKLNTARPSMSRFSNDLMLPSLSVYSFFVSSVAGILNPPAGTITDLCSAPFEHRCTQMSLPSAFSMRVAEPQSPKTILCDLSFSLIILVVVSPANSSTLSHEPEATNVEAR